MTAEFNITIPGAEIIKRLSDLEQQVIDLAASHTRLDAQEQRLVELATTYTPVSYVDKQMELLSGRLYRRLDDEVAVLKDLIDGKIKPTNTPATSALLDRINPLKTASASRVERIAEDLAGLNREVHCAIIEGGEELEQVKGRVTAFERGVTDQISKFSGRFSELEQLVDQLEDQTAALTDMAHGRIRPSDMPDLHELVIGVNTLHKLVDDFGGRLEKLEDAVNWHEGANMENAHAPNIPANEPEPPVDTPWRPYVIGADYPLGEYPLGGKRVVVLTRADHINGPLNADAFDWGECEDNTIVAWRYAKEGE